MSCTLPTANIDQPDGGAALGQPDAGVADNTWPLAQTHRLTTGSVQAVQLAANDSAVFGITDHNGIWTLAAGDTAVRMIVPPGDTTVDSEYWGRLLVVSGSDLFWLDCVAGAVHRANVDGSNDQILAAGVEKPDTLAVDDTSVYWSEVTYMHDGGGIVRSIPRNAAPGDPTVTLASAGEAGEISSLAASAGAVYWTTTGTVGTGPSWDFLDGASTDALLHGGSITEIDVDSDGLYGTVAMGGEVLYGAGRDVSENIWTTTLFGYWAAAGVKTPLSILPANVRLAGLAVTDDWLIVTGGRNPQTQLYIASRWGGGPVMIANGLPIPAIVGPAGITFIDSSGALVFIKVADLNYLGFGRPAPP